MVCYDRHRRRQATVQLAPLHSWHLHVRLDRRDHCCRRHRRSHHCYLHNRRHHRCRNHRRSRSRRPQRRGDATAIAIRACRDIIAPATSRESGEGGSEGCGGGYRGGNDVSVRGRLVSNAVTHPMTVLATGAAGPFESRRCPADPGHVALSPAPFTVG